MRKIENYFANKEISAFHFCENLQRIISQDQTRKTLQITTVTGKPSNPSCQKINPFFFERINFSEEEKDSLLTNCEEVAKERNNVFANAVQSLSIPNYENCDSLAQKKDDPTLKAIIKWRNHPSILTIATEYKKSKPFFQFCF